MPNKAKYHTLMEHLKDDIVTGRYPAGTRIPSENELTALFGVSRQTVRQALSMLENEGYIEKKRGSGSVVRSTFGSNPRTNDIAVITTFIGDYIFPQLLSGIEETLRAGGYSPLIMATRNRVDQERGILLDILARPVRGLIIEGTKTALPNPNIDLYRRLYDRGLPIVFVHGYYPDLSPPVYVVADDRQGAFEAVRYLKDRGHRNIAGIFKSDDMQGHGRYAGYIQALHEFSLPVNDDRLLWYTNESKKSIIAGQALRTIEGCSALVCYNDSIAVDVMELLKPAGIRVPHDLAVIGFDDSRYGNLTGVRITSMSYGTKELGRLAAEKLLNMLGGVSEQPAVMPWSLVEKESVCDLIN